MVSFKGIYPVLYFVLLDVRVIASTFMHKSYSSKMPYILYKLVKFYLLK